MQKYVNELAKEFLKKGKKLLLVEVWDKILYLRFEKGGQFYSKKGIEGYVGKVYVPEGREKIAYETLAPKLKACHQTETLIKLKTKYSKLVRSWIGKQLVSQILQVLGFESFIRSEI